MHDIYDPPPIPQVDWAPTRDDQLLITRGDVACLVCLCLGLLGLALLVWHSEPILALIAAGAGMLVILESWFTVLGHLRLHPDIGLKARWTFFLAALVPWLIGVGCAVALMLCLFWLSDHAL